MDFPSCTTSTSNRSQRCGRTTLSSKTALPSKQSFRIRFRVFVLHFRARKLFCRRWFNLSWHIVSMSLRHPPAPCLQLLGHSWRCADVWWDKCHFKLNFVGICFVLFGRFLFCYVNRNSFPRNPHSQSSQSRFGGDKKWSFLFRPFSRLDEKYEAENCS